MRIFEKRRAGVKNATLLMLWVVPFRQYSIRFGRATHTFGAGDCRDHCNIDCWNIFDVHLDKHRATGYGVRRVVIRGRVSREILHVCFR